jgi:hypothetical protein
VIVDALPARPIGIAGGLRRFTGGGGAGREWLLEIDTRLGAEVDVADTGGGGEYALCAMGTAIDVPFASGDICEVSVSTAEIAGYESSL